jgi:hypothetical protein
MTIILNWILVIYNLTFVPLTTHLAKKAVKWDYRHWKVALKQVSRPKSK